MCVWPWRVFALNVLTTRVQGLPADVDVLTVKRCAPQIPHPPMYSGELKIFSMIETMPPCLNRSGNVSSMACVRCW